MFHDLSALHDVRVFDGRWSALSCSHHHSRYPRIFTDLYMVHNNGDIPRMGLFFEGHRFWEHGSLQFMIPLVLCRPMPKKSNETLPDNSEPPELMARGPAESSFDLS